MKTVSIFLPALVVACAPNLTSDDWLITSARVIAIRGEPPETKPGGTATFTAFIADPTGGSHKEPVFAFCTAPKPSVENAVVSTACLGDGALVPLGSGDSVTKALPASACTLFGPIAAPGGFRPRDPDPTGGYYQPLRVALEGAPPTFHLARISCGVENASNDVATEFATTYVPNQNPHIASLGAAIGGHTASLDAVPPGARVDLSVTWTDTDAEHYVYFDPSTLTLTSVREAIQVAWYASRGALDAESTSRSADDEALSVANAWTAPASGTSELWIVLRDSRGGVDVVHRRVTTL